MVVVILPLKKWLFCISPQTATYWVRPQPPPPMSSKKDTTAEFFAPDGDGGDGMSFDAVTASMRQQRAIINGWQV